MKIDYIDFFQNEVTAWMMASNMKSQELVLEVSLTGNGLISPLWLSARNTVMMNWLTVSFTLSGTG